MISFDSDVLILGRYLALKNRLVTENPPTEIRLYTYTDGTTYGRTDTLTLKSGYDIESSYTTVPVISSTDFKITITDVRLLAGKDCWCLTDNAVQTITPSVFLSGKYVTFSATDLDSNTSSWCVTDENDNILIYVNQSGTMLAKIRFDFLNKRSEINYNY
jgi:hypothetical protein